MSILTQEQQRFLDIAALRAITHTPQFNERVYIQNVANPSDIKEYAWESSSTLSDDGVNVIKVTAIATGRFHLVNVDAKFINKSTSLPSGINDGDTYFQDEVVTGTTQTSPNRFWGKVGGVWIELFQSWWQLFGTILKLRSSFQYIRDSIQIETASGASQGNIGFHTIPSIREYGIRSAKLRLEEQATVFTSDTTDLIFASRYGLGIVTGRVDATPTQYVQLLTSIPYSGTSGAWKFKIRVSPETGGSGGFGSIEYNVKFIHYGGVISDYGASQNGFLSGSIMQNTPEIRIGDVGGQLAILIDSHHTVYSAHHVTVAVAEFLPWGTGTLDSVWFKDWVLSAASSLPVTVTAPLPMQNDFRDIISNGTIFSRTGQTTITPIPSMEKFKEILPEISDETAIKLAALLPRRLFRYIESGNRAYGWIVEEVQNAFETVRIGSSEAEQALLDDLLNDTVLMFDERKVFPKDWQPFEPKQADEQGEMTDEEYKEYIDKFQKEQDAALSDFTKRFEELPTEKLYTINPDAIAYIKDRAFHIVLSKF